MSNRKKAAPVNPRRLAVTILLKINQGDGYSNLVLDEALQKGGMSKADNSFVSALVYGVLERKITLDYLLSRHLSKPLSKTPPYVIECLRSALYQIRYMDKVPKSAAVDEAVKLTKSSQYVSAAGMVNAVLRNLVRDKTELPKGDSQQDISVRYSCPLWYVGSLIKDYGKDRTIGFLEDSVQVPPLYIRANTLKTNSMSLLHELQAGGIETEAGYLPESIKLTHPGSIEKNPLFLEGLFHVEDIASQICVNLLSPNKGERILDICAAPGGKSFTIAQCMENTGEVISRDLYESRTSLIKSGAERLGITNITALTGDAAVYDETLGTFDRVLCDVPCSGFGIIRRKPDIKYKDPDSIKALPALQLQILQTGAAYLKPGGLLVYSTCTLRRSENESVARRFLEANRDFTAEKIDIPQIESAVKDEPWLTLMPPGSGSDGFFMAAFRRANN